MSELAADGIPVAVSLRVLKLSRQSYYRWRKQRVTQAELIEAYRANALLDAHADDPEYGYRFLVDEAAEVSGPRRRSGGTTSGGPPSARSAARTGNVPDHRSTTTWSSATSPPMTSTNCG